MSEELETPLTDEELAAGDGYTPALTSTDCRPRPRLGEKWQAFAHRMRFTTTDGEQTPAVGVVENDRFNRYLAKKVRESHVASTDYDVTVQIICGEVWICMPDGKAFRVELPRWGDQIAAGVRLAFAELERRAFR